MQRPSPKVCPPARAAQAPDRDADLRTILSDAGLWPGLSLTAVIDRIETEARTSR